VADVLKQPSSKTGAGSLRNTDLAFGFKSAAPFLPATQNADRQKTTSSVAGRGTATHTFRMLDIAKMAGVSTATVSRVINQQGCVAASTRARVELILNEVGFERNEHALALQQERVGVRKPSHSESDGPVDCRKGLPYLQEDEISRDTSEGCAREPKPNFGGGQRIRFHHGQEVIQGVIDEWMPDGSGLWVWGDGIGRKFLPLNGAPLIMWG
jgi:hypothetical protein